MLLVAIFAAFTKISVPCVSLERGDFVPPVAVLPEFSIVKTDSGYLASAIKPVLINFSGSVFTLNSNKYTAPDHFYRNDTLFVPAGWMAFILTKVIKGYAYWDEKEKLFLFTKDKPTVKKVFLQDMADSVVLSVNYSQNAHLKPSISSTGPSVVQVFLPGGFYWKTNTIRHDKVIRQVDISHTARGAVFTVALGEGSAGYNLTDRTDGFRLAVYTRRKVEQPKRKRRKIELIVVDPGHGGKDPGAIGYKNLREKSITLPVALALADSLRKRLGVKVVVTREDDRFITLGDRTRIANRLGADLFISLHCNWSKNKKAQGTETYFLSEARTDWERSVAAFENKAVEYEGRGADKSDMVGYILSDMVQNEYLKESQDLARFVQESVVKRTGFVNRGVKQAGFYVLRGCYMPAILVEMAFVSNKHDAKALQTKKTQAQIIKGIVDGVAQFKRKYEE